MKNILLISSIVLMILFPIWFFIIYPELVVLKTDYMFYEEQEGKNRFLNLEGVSNETFTHFNKNEVKAIGSDGRYIILESWLEATNVDTGEVFLDETREFHVDKYTLAHNNFNSGFFGFAPDVEKRNYFLTFPQAFQHAIYNFKGIDYRWDMNIYVFQCVSEPYDITNAIPIFGDRNIYSWYNCEIWIDPITGKQLYFKLSWKSYEMEGEIKGNLVEEGFKETTDEYIQKHLEEIKEGQFEILFLKTIIPIIFLVSGFGLLGLLRIQQVFEDKNVRKKKRKNKKRKRKK